MYTILALQNNELCEKFNNNIPLSELQGNHLVFSMDSQDIQSIQDDFPTLDLSNVTAILLSVGNGWYSEVYVTESSRPFELNSTWHSLAYYL